jgi:hypothetical protein
LKLIDELGSPRRDGEGSEVVGCLGGNDRLDKGHTAGRGDKFTTPRWDLAGAIVFEVLKVHAF